MTQIFEIQSTIKYIYDLFVFIRTGMKKGRFISSHRDKLKKKKKNCTWNNYFDFEKKKLIKNMINMIMAVNRIVKNFCFNECLTNFESIETK